MVALSLSASQSLLSISNLVRFYWIAATLNTANAAFSTSSLQSSQSNEVKIDEITCSQVIRSVGFSIVDNAKIQHDVKFLCAVDPNSETSSKLSIQKEGTWLALSNTEPDFEDSWKTAHKQGLTRLIVRDGNVKGSVLELDSHNSSKDSESSSVVRLQSKTSIILASGDTQTTTDDIYANKDYIIPVDDGIQRSNSTGTLFKRLHFKKQSIEWKSPLHRHGQKTSNGSSTRKLAINQTGDKTALVFRVTTPNNGSPTNTANEVSNGVFGTFGDTVTLTSMYSACSYGLLNIAPAVFGGTSATGVVDVTVSTTGTTYDIENEIRTQYGSALDNIDHVLFHVPFGTEKVIGGGTNWVAYANFPGKYGTYNDDYIIDVQTLLHETGHNIGLAHSGFNGDEYADTSCYMGYTVADGDRNNAQKCFNAAKMDELGWYSNRVTTIKPLFNEEFSGKVIGVADYGTSDSSHTLSLKIANPNKSVNPIFLTYNRAKGINEDTHAGRDQIRIVQGNAGEKSWLLASANPGQTLTYNNYYNGRGLQFIFGSGAQDGSIDYVPVTVAQETLPCNTNDECTSKQSVCNIGTCIDGACVFELQSSCCGNGLCEPSNGEHCSSCALDCELGTNCNEVDGRDDNTAGGIYGLTAFGIKFNVDVLSDIYFYEIEADVMTQSGSVNAKIFTYDGPFESASSDLSQWDKVFDGESSLANFYKVTMTFNMPKLSASGSTRAFYIAYETSAAFFFNGDPGVEVSNSDVTVRLSEITGQLSNNVIPGAINYGYTTNFLGGIKYTYGDETMIRTFFPSTLPTTGTTNEPSGVPSRVASISPTNAPSITPSMIETNDPSSQPSTKPSTVPSRDASEVPSARPSGHPSVVPSSQPSTLPSLHPSTPPSMKPSGDPTHEPSAQVSVVPSRDASEVPSARPSGHPSVVPSSQPSTTPSLHPSTLSSMKPSGDPTHEPSAQVSAVPSRDASEVPSARPSSHPSVVPSSQPSTLPSLHPSTPPSMKPSGDPTHEPSAQVSAVPSRDASEVPSARPSSHPSVVPSGQPSTLPSLHPSTLPSKTSPPSRHPITKAPTTCIDDPLFNFILDNGNVQNCQWLTRNSDPDTTASRIAKYCSRGHVKGACQSTCEYCPCQDDVAFEFRLDIGRLRSCDWLLKNKDPLIDATRVDKYCYADEGKTIASAVGNACVLSCGFCGGRDASEVPSARPSGHPSVVPSSQPSTLPSLHPSTLPSMKPSGDPTHEPSAQVSAVPSRDASEVPSARPSGHPSVVPSSHPSTLPSQHPSTSPSMKPSGDPTHEPSSQVSAVPSRDASEVPSARPSSHPSVVPSSQPSTLPSLHPSTLPSKTTSPSRHPITKAPTTCIDDPLFNFILDNGNVQNCQWLTRNSDPDTTASRIAKYCSRGHVKGACQSTCEYCPCQDDVAFEFRLDIGRLRSCDWLLKNKDPLIDATRVDKYCYADEGKTIASAVGNACVLSCGFCSVSF